MSLIFASTHLCAQQVEFYIAPADSASEAVILVHGLRGSHQAMQKLQQQLSANHYHVINVDYPSVNFDMQTLANDIFPQAIQEAEKLGAERIHFVTHSLGSLLLRYYLQTHTCGKLGQVVMLSPPNHGSEIIEAFENWPFFRNYNGPAGMQLDARDGAFIDSLQEPIDFPLGIIMSDMSIHPIMSLVLPGNDDGRVSVSSAKLNGMTDFKIVHCTHHWLMKNPRVIRLVLAFLRNNHF